MSPRRIVGLLVLAGLMGCTDPGIEGLERELRDIRSVGEASASALLTDMPGTTVSLHHASLSYEAMGLRSPFMSQALTVMSTGPPESGRSRQPLEAYPIESLDLVGTLTVGDRPSALLRTPNGRIYRLHPGDYLGTDAGRIVSIATDEVRLVERIADGRGGWSERWRRLALGANGRERSRLSDAVDD